MPALGAPDFQDRRSKCIGGQTVLLLLALAGLGMVFDFLAIKALALLITAVSAFVHQIRGELILPMPYLPADRKLSIFNAGGPSARVVRGMIRTLGDVLPPALTLL